MVNLDDRSDKDKFHMKLVVQIWDKIAGLAYARYKKEGRGAVIMFMLDNIPATLKEILPPLPKMISSRPGALATAYVPRSELLMLENIIGEQGVLRLDRKLGEYDPDTTIVFAVIETETDENGKNGVVSSGFDVTPPSFLYPREMYDKKLGFGEYSLSMKGSKNNPLLNLN